MTKSQKPRRPKRASARKKLTRTSLNQDSDQAQTADGPKPSRVTDVYWLHAERKHDNYPEPTSRAGKWLIFVPLASLAQTWAQIKGIAAVGVYTFVIAMVFWQVLKATIGIRVSAEEEQQGLDISEHGNQAYPDFSISTR